MFSSKLLELVNSLGLDGADEAELGGDPVHLLAQQPRQQLPAEHQRSYELRRPTKYIKFLLKQLNTKSTKSDINELK